MIDFTTRFCWECGCDTLHTYHYLNIHTLEASNEDDEESELLLKCEECDSYCEV